MGSALIIHIIKTDISHHLYSNFISSLNIQSLITYNISMHYFQTLISIVLMYQIQIPNSYNDMNLVTLYLLIVHFYLPGRKEYNTFTIRQFGNPQVVKYPIGLGSYLFTPFYTRSSQTLCQYPLPVALPVTQDGNWPRRQAASLRAEHLSETSVSPAIQQTEQYHCHDRVCVTTRTGCMLFH